MVRRARTPRRCGRGGSQSALLADRAGSSPEKRIRAGVGQRADLLGGVARQPRERDAGLSSAASRAGSRPAAAACPPVASDSTDALGRSSSWVSRSWSDEGAIALHRSKPRGSCVGSSRRRCASGSRRGRRCLARVEGRRSSGALGVRSLAARRCSAEADCWRAARAPERLDAARRADGPFAASRPSSSTDLPVARGRHAARARRRLRVAATCRRRRERALRRSRSSGAGLGCHAARRQPRRRPGLDQLRRLGRRRRSKTALATSRDPARLDPAERALLPTSRASRSATSPARRSSAARRELPAKALGVPERVRRKFVGLCSLANAGVLRLGAADRRVDDVVESAPAVAGAAAPPRLRLRAHAPRAIAGSRARHSPMRSCHLQRLERVLRALGAAADRRSRHRDRRRGGTGEKNEVTAPLRATSRGFTPTSRRAAWSPTRSWSRIVERLLRAA